MKSHVHPRRAHDCTRRRHSRKGASSSLGPAVNGKPAGEPHEGAPRSRQGEGGLAHAAEGQTLCSAKGHTLSGPTGVSEACGRQPPGRGRRRRQGLAGGAWGATAQQPGVLFGVMQSLTVTRNDGCTSCACTQCQGATHFQILS